MEKVNLQDRGSAGAKLGAPYIWIKTGKWTFVARGDIGLGDSDPAKKTVSIHMPNLKHHMEVK